MNTDSQSTKSCQKQHFLRFIWERYDLNSLSSWIQQSLDYITKFHVRLTENSTKNFFRGGLLIFNLFDWPRNSRSSALTTKIYCIPVLTIESNSSEPHSGSEFCIQRRGTASGCLQFSYRPERFSEGFWLNLHIMEFDKLPSLLWTVFLPRSRSSCRCLARF